MHGLEYALEMAYFGDLGGGEHVTHLSNSASVICQQSGL